MGLLDWLPGRGARKQQRSAVESFAVRAVSETVTHDGYEFEIFDVQAKGALPVIRQETECAIVTHIHDITGDKPMPIFSHMEGTCEEETGVFESTINVGIISPGSYLTDWVSLFPIVMEALEFPFKGQRDIAVVSHLLPTDAPPVYRYGFQIGDEGIVLAKSEIVIDWHTLEEGYVELSQNREKAQELIVQLGFYIAASDRHLDPDEAMVIKNWGKSKLTHSNPQNRENRKKRLNEVINRAYKLASSQSLDLSRIVNELNEVASDRDKYEAIELCLDVMSADGIAEPAELKELDRLALLLKVDRGKFRALQDRRLTQVRKTDFKEDNLDRLVGITEDMDIGKIKKHLTAEYRKWNSRSSSSDPKIREKAKEMLLLIGRARNFHLNQDKNQSSASTTLPNYHRGSESPNKSPALSRPSKTSPSRAQSRISPSSLPHRRHDTTKFKAGDQGVMIRWISKNGIASTRIFHMATQITEVHTFILQIKREGADKDTIKRSFVTWDNIKGWK